MARVPPLRGAAVALVAALAGCASPPTRELAIAQGAIDAARAAGAAAFARDELTAAESTLSRAQAAVTERDYRAALGYALDAHLKAQDAAKAAADGRVRAQLAADERLDRLTAAIARLDAAIAGPEARRVPASARRRGQAAITRAKTHAAAARDAVGQHDPRVVAAEVERTERIMADLDAALAGLAPTPTTRSRRR